jgi:cytochrome c oxidase assembly factor CtaG
MYKNIRTYGLMAVFGILIVVSLQPTFIEVTEQGLANHMVLEHSLFFIAGALSVMIAETVLRFLVFSERKRDTDLRKSKGRLTLIIGWSTLLRKIFTLNKFGFIWIIISIILLAFWHVPFVFDFAALHEPIHILQHLSFIIVGATVFLAIRALGESFKILLLFSAMGIMAFAGLFFIVLHKRIYIIYSVSSHNDAGTYMIISCMLLLFIGLPLYLIQRTLFHIRIRSAMNNDKI